MSQQFAVPRWATLLTRMTHRRVRQVWRAAPLRVRRRTGRVATRRQPDIHELLNEPFWDPVVVIVDPWRRCSDPLRDAAWQAALKAMPQPRLTTPWHDDLPVPAVQTPVQAERGSDIARPPRLAALMTMSNPGANSDDDRLTQQLIATARAMPIDRAAQNEATVSSTATPLLAIPQDNKDCTAVDYVTAEATQTTSRTPVDAFGPVASDLIATTSLTDEAASLAPDLADVAADLASPKDRPPVRRVEAEALAAEVSAVVPAVDVTGVNPVPAEAFVDSSQVQNEATDAEPEAQPAGAGVASTEDATDVAGAMVDEPSKIMTSASPDEANAPDQATTPGASEPVTEAVALEVAPTEVAVATEEPPPAATPPAEPPLSEATAAMPEAAAEVAEEVAVPETDAANVPDASEAEPALQPAIVAEAEVVPPPAEEARESKSPADSAATAIKSAASTVLAPAVRDEYNRTGVDFRRPWPRPKVRGLVIDWHCHLLARRHAEDWFEAADHFGMDCFLTMSPLEEAVALARDWGHRLRFIAVPQWGDASPNWVDKWLNRIEGFYNLGSRVAKFHASPGTMVMRGHRLDSPAYKPLFAEVKARGMAIMTHIGDPDTWYHGKYDPAKFGSREEHFAMWEALLDEHRGHPWIGAHMGGNPEDLPRLQRLLDRFPDLSLDCSATRWMVREISARREPAREFFIRNADRILFGSDQVSGDDRQFDFLASRIWCHRKLWETAYIGPSPIIDPDLPVDQQPTMRGLALPDVVLQKIYHDNAAKLLAKLGMPFEVPAG